MKGGVKEVTRDSRTPEKGIEDKTPVQVLVVEDEAHIRTSLIQYLEDLGFRALSCESAEEALEILAGTPVDVAVVDIRLPKMDGNSLILRAHKIRPGTKFLIHTGSTGYKLPRSVEDLGVTREDIFNKPLPDLGVIAEAIRKKTGPRI